MAEDEDDLFAKLATAVQPGTHEFRANTPVLKLRSHGHRPQRDGAPALLTVAGNLDGRKKDVTGNFARYLGDKRERDLPRLAQGIDQDPLRRAGRMPLRSEPGWLFRRRVVLLGR